MKPRRSPAQLATLEVSDRLNQAWHDRLTEDQRKRWDAAAKEVRKPK